MSRNRVTPPTPPPSDHGHVVEGLLVLLAVVVLGLSLATFSATEPSTNWLGILGHTLGAFSYVTFGLLAFPAFGFIAWMGWRVLIGREHEHLTRTVILSATILGSLGILLCLGEDIGLTLRPKSLQHAPGGVHYNAGGSLMHYAYSELPSLSLRTLLNRVGVGVVFGTLLLTSLLSLYPSPARWVVRRLKARRHREQEEKPDTSLWRMVKLKMSSSPREKRSHDADETQVIAIRPDKELLQRPSLSSKSITREKTERVAEPKVSAAPEASKNSRAQNTPAPRRPSKRELAMRAQRVHNGDFTVYELPPPDLLTAPKSFDHTSLKADLRRQAEVLEETLQSFGIDATVGQINCGPTITSFEVHPAIGVKVQKIKALENDIALNMEAHSIRIIAPIPGKAAVGIEVPNPKPQEVSFKELLLHYQGRPAKKLRIPVLLGKAVNGDSVINDLAKMPHCIIAGATGSGKSVCINTIVMSIVMNARPDEIKLLMVDPKKVELTPYSQLPHMLAPVITEPTGACTALLWLVREMEKRYELLKLFGVRNIDGFNGRKRDFEFEESLNVEVPDHMPYIVGIIDELADLMMVSSHDIETPIARIAQMARAVGIHLILATQRPSREVITGLIKANFPTRLSFKVSSRVNSQIILDETGAETLLGNGDMLFLPPGTSTTLRAQGAFVRDEDIKRVIDFVCAQAPTNYAIESFDKIDSLDDLLPDDEKEPQVDSLYQQARELVVSSQNASTTFLQRKLKIGYARAASLIDQLEDNEVIAPAEGGKGRQVLLQPEGTEPALTAATSFQDSVSPLD